MQGHLVQLRAATCSYHRMQVLGTVAAGDAATSTEAVATVNANGAGDAFVAGLLSAVVWQSALTLRAAGRLGLLSALQRVDSSLREAKSKATLAQLAQQAMQE